jgi:hypothetical protein
MNERQQQKSNDQCLDMGLLVCLRDDELTADEAAQARAHLASCPDCAADERGVANASQEVYGLLDTLGPLTNEIADAATAYAAIQARLDIKNDHENRPATVQALVESRPRVSYGNRRRRYGWLAAAAAAVLIAVLLLPNAGALAYQFLALFSVQQFQPVSVDPQNFSNDLMSYLRDFSDMQVQYNSIPTSMRHPTQVQVKQWIHFPLLLPGHLPQGVGHTMNFTLIGSAGGAFTFNASKAQAYLRQSGQSNIRIPAQLAGATFTITSDSGVIIHYASNCRLARVTALLCSGGTPFYAAEIPSPVVQATGKASLKDLRDFLLSLPRLAPEMRSMLQQLDLEKGIVPLPIPREVAAQQVTIHGAPGIVLVDNSLKVGGLIWQTRGIIYMIATTTVSSTDLLDTANSFA